MPRDQVVLDTDIASLLWRGKLAPPVHGKLRGRIPAHSFQLLHCDYEVVKAWGRLSGSAIAAGTTVPANDCWIAACCVVHDYPLLSGNAKQFAFLEPFGLRLL
jgi:predicted nucleic acid-binding protein